MDVNGLTARLPRRYRLVLAATTVASTVVAAGLLLARHPTHTAHARIIAAATTPRTPAEAAAVVSEVRALATSHDVVAAALAAAPLERSPESVGAHVTVTGLGGSALIDLAYTDAVAPAAQQVTTALTRTVVARLDAMRAGGLPAALGDIDSQLANLAGKRAPIAASAQASPKDAVAQNRLAGIDRLIADLTADRNRLASESAATARASIVALPTRPPPADPRGLPVSLGVALILGLALGVLILAVHMAVCPTVSGPARVGRLLGVPLLGEVSPDPATVPGPLTDAGQRARLAARRAGVSTVIVYARPPAPDLVRRIASATLRPELAVGRPRTQPVEPAVGPDPAPFLEQPALARGHAPIATLAHTENGKGQARLRRVCAVDELDPAAEADAVGVIVLAGASTPLTTIGAVRNLLATSGWPLLGVLGVAGTGPGDGGSST